MKDKNRATTLTTAANAVELGTRIIQSIAGNEISNVVAGSSLDDTIRATLTAKIATHLNIQGVK